MTVLFLSNNLLKFITKNKDNFFCIDFWPNNINPETKKIIWFRIFGWKDNTDVKLCICVRKNIDKDLLEQLIKKTGKLKSTNLPDMSHYQWYEPSIISKGDLYNSEDFKKINDKILCNLRTLLTEDIAEINNIDYPFA